MFALVGVAKVIEDVEISRKHPMDGYMQRFIEQDFAKINDDIPIDRKFLPYITARIDINWISALGDLQIISNSDERSSVEKIDSDIDLKKGEIKNLTKNKTYTFNAYPPEIQKLIEAGGLVNYTKQKLGEK